MVRKFIADTSGATMMEYGLIAAGLALAIIAGATQIQGAVALLLAEPTAKLTQPLN